MGTFGGGVSRRNDGGAARWHLWYSSRRTSKMGRMGSRARRKWNRAGSAERTRWMRPGRTADSQLARRSAARCICLARMLWWNSQSSPWRDSGVLRVSEGARAWQTVQQWDVLTVVRVCARSGHVMRAHLFSESEGGAVGVGLPMGVPACASGVCGGHFPCPGAVDQSKWESRAC